MGFLLLLSAPSPSSRCPRSPGEISKSCVTYANEIAGSEDQSPKMKSEYWMGNHAVLRAVRTKARLKLGEVSRDSGVHITTICRFEKGYQKLSVEKVRNIVRAMSALGADTSSIKV